MSRIGARLAKLERAVGAVGPRTFVVHVAEDALDDAVARLRKAGIMSGADDVWNWGLDSEASPDLFMDGYYWVWPFQTHEEYVFYLLDKEAGKPVREPEHEMGLIPAE
ncbi:hypothetical protein ABEG18_19270 [Alsobacter sp. KACC 23698]|uniref:Uncharacterized protein n=1 Tax=Alsobacter sp. KACC 23698 TaxID=3149229 RepID=A0AAU7JBT5_9HYPH